MQTARTSLIASLVILWTGMFWGLYWLPVRRLEALGLGGAWGTAAITAAAALVLMPFVVTRRHQLKHANPIGIASIALGGVAFALYSIGFLYGRVAMIILLWFLSPVWSILIGRYLMGWSTPGLRLVAVSFGLIGLFIMLGAEGSIPLPQGLGEWMSLFGGVLWSFSTTGIRAKSNLEPAASALIFALGAAATALVLAPFLASPPVVDTAALGTVIVIAVFTGGLWWGLSTAALIWAAMRVDPARVSILLMTEVLVGAITASWFAQEHLSALELAGGAMVLAAGVLEVWPVRTGKQP
jgi:drug/metabolite transporter (DMT)-like permease